MNEKKVAILQSNYIPWKGYFDLINTVDEFIFYDEVQYTAGDWRNRNKIKTERGLLWLTIPVNAKGRLNNSDLKINNITISDKGWARKHWESIKQFYKKAPHFRAYKDIFEELYASCEAEELLCQANYKFIKAINQILGINTIIKASTDYTLIEGKTDRLVSLCSQAGATEYISGPSAKSYIDPTLFAEAGIKLSWMDYAGYPEYPQLFPPFEHAVTILDLLFSCGEEAKNLYALGKTYE